MKEKAPIRVEDLAEEYDVGTVSAIRSYGYLGPFRPRPKVDFRGVRLFDVLLRPDQVLCSSTVLSGDSEENLYGKWGVVVGSGTVENAFPYDATTTVVDGEVSSIFSDRVKNISKEEQIASAIYERTTYNELDVRAESLAGVYCCKNGEQKAEDLPSEKTMEFVDRLKMPIFLIQDGRFYKVDNFSDRAKESKSVSPKELLDFSIDLSEEEKDNLKEYLTNNLVLAPRNAVTSGIYRGKFAFKYRHDNDSDFNDFLSEQAELIDSKNRESLRTYGAVALHQFALDAMAHEYADISRIAQNMAKKVISLTEFEALSNRVEEKGHLSILNSDLEHYLNTGKLPEYLSDH